jgi:hypothetical protein
MKKKILLLAKCIVVFFSSAVEKFDIILTATLLFQKKDIFVVCKSRDFPVRYTRRGIIAYSIYIEYQSVCLFVRIVSPSPPPRKRMSLPHTVHTECMATAAFWRTFHHDGKISQGWSGWGCSTLHLVDWTLRNCWNFRRRNQPHY